MLRLVLILPCLLLFAAAVRAQGTPKIVLVIHGGAGLVEEAKMTPARAQQYRAALEAALRAGEKALQKGTSLDAVEAAIVVLEDSPLFNAGKGAVFNREGRHELNASLMDGKTRQAGAVAGVERLKNPIAAARLVMEKSPHVLMIGAGAERFAREQGAALVSPLYFWTEERWQALKEAEAARQTTGTAQPRQHFGTVGAVALDRAGNLAAGTSTGGLTYVLPGRVGDSPLIGAGTYADNATCAVSCTGHGEVFIRHQVAGDVAARVRYKKDTLATAVREALKELPEEPDGVGGIIALDRQGHAALEFNTNGMYRGTLTADGMVSVAIYRK